MKFCIFMGLELCLICSATWSLLSMEEKKRKIEEQSELLEQQTEGIKVPSLFNITLPYLRQYAQQLLDEKKSINQSEEQPIPIEVFSKIINDPLFFGNTMLHLIADKNDIEILLAYKANPNLPNDDGQTVLNYLLALHNINAAQKLLELADDDLDIITPDYFGSSPLLNAIKTGDHDIVQSIINRAVGNPKIDIHKYILQKNVIGQTACSLASKSAPEIIPLLLPYINFEEEQLLITAVRDNNIKSIKILLENGYPIELSDQYGSTALNYAVDFGHEEAITELLKYRPNLTRVFFEGTDAETTIAAIIGESNSVTIASKFLKAGLPIDFGADYDGTMLFTAAEFGHLDLIRFLLENQADPNKGSSTETPLEAVLTSYEGDYSVIFDIIIELLKNPQINVQNTNNENTLLTQFLKIDFLVKGPLEKKKRIIELFIEHGSPVSSIDLELTKDYPEIQEILRQNHKNQ